MDVNISEEARNKFDHFDRIYLQHGYDGREALQIRHWNALQNENRLEVTHKNKFSPKEVVTNLFIGSVEWIEKILEHNFTPDYFPKWIFDVPVEGEVSRSYHTIVHTFDERIVYPVWVKPPYYKKFESFAAYSRKQIETKTQPPFFICPLHEGPFLYEWRYYISNGAVLAAEWYKGMDDVERDPPKFPWEIPESYSGAVDIGMPYYYDGLRAYHLIEAHHPFSCGWYGHQKDIEKYLQWAWGGWNYCLDAVLFVVDK